MSNQKYEITDIAHEEYPFLHRIRALRDIGSEVKAGNLGGFVEHEGNLSYEDADSWIYDDAIAANGAFVCDGTVLDELIDATRRNREPLIHCATYLELCARDPDGLRALRESVFSELIRSKLSAERLILRQQEGFLTANPAGRRALGTQFERVFPASSAANLYPLNYSGKTDPHGFYIGKDKYGSNIIADLNRRARDKTNANGLILGNSGEGKSFLLKLLVVNLLLSGKSVICLDPEHEMGELCSNIGGCFVDLMSGQFIINPLEPKMWDGGGGEDETAPAPFRQRSRLSQHISFLKDFFRSYKDFSDRHIDVIELMLERLYAGWDMDDGTDFSTMQPEPAVGVECSAVRVLGGLRDQVAPPHGEDLSGTVTKAVLWNVRLGGQQAAVYHPREENCHGTQTRRPRAKNVAGGDFLCHTSNLPTSKGATPTRSTCPSFSATRERR